MSTGIAVGTSTGVRYTEKVRYWEGPLSEVPLYTVHKIDSGIMRHLRHLCFPLKTDALCEIIIA